MRQRVFWLLILVLLPAAIASASGVRFVNFDNSTETFTIDETDVVGGAGGDVPATFESPDRTFDVDCWALLGSPPSNWHIDISRTDVTWDTDLHVYVRRSGSGSGATLTGGTTYQEVTTTPTYFFSGSGGDCTGIPVRCQVSGSYAALGIPAGAYRTTITYTVSTGL
jgi:hypothetical protein